MDRRDFVLAVLAAAEGQPYTPVQIQKACFIISDKIPNLINEGPAFNFQPYDYGPFDSAVYSTLTALQREFACEIAPSPAGNWNTYAATKHGVTLGNEIMSGLRHDKANYIKKISNWVRSLDFNTLVKSIYDAYPHMRANSIFRG